MFCKYEWATSIMVIMAQPLDVKAPPVRICYFGTNNKFTAIDVENRIAYITSELKKNGIWVETYSADGDARELKMMRNTINLGISPPVRGIKSKKYVKYFGTYET
jgi:hypothetical protein